jgi:hypothetical protein
MWGWLFLIPFALLCFVQNAAYTWSSKTRAGNNPQAHRVAGWASNGIYYVSQIVQTVYTVKYLADNIMLLLASCVVYLWATSEGSVYMMNKFLRLREQVDEAIVDTVGIPGAMSPETAQLTLDIPEAVPTDEEVQFG